MGVTLSLSIEGDVACAYWETKVVVVDFVGLVVEEGVRVLVPGVHLQTQRQPLPLTRLHF